MIAVSLEGVEKRYGKAQALRGLTLEVEKGELYGLVGVNGAGKTSALSSVLGFVRPSAGHVKVLGQDPWNNPPLQGRLSWLPGEVRLESALSGRAWLRYQASVGSLKLAGLDALEREWEAVLDRPMRTLSKGNRQKVALLRLLLSEAEVLVLDEPTSGLDPIAQERLLETLRERARAGRTVLFSSHSLAEVSALCDRVAVLDGGRALEVGRPETLSGAGGRSLKVWTQRPIAPEALVGWQAALEHPTHAVVRGERLLEDALPRLLPFGVERAEYGSEGLEGLLARLHGQPGGAA